MKTKYHFLLYGLLGFAVLTAALFGANAVTRAARAQQSLEDTYVRSFMEAQEQLQTAAAELAKLPAAADDHTRAEALARISRSADRTADELAALPLSHTAMSDTVTFCNQLSEYTLGLALEGSAPDADTLEQLEQCRQQCMLLLGQLSAARESMLAGNLLLSQEQSAFYLQAQPDVRPLERAADPDHGMDYPSMVYDGAFSDARRTGIPRALGSTLITPEQAVTIARQFIGEERVRSAESGASAGGVMPSHGVTLTLTDGTVLNAEVTQQGGQLLWIMPEHASFEPRLTLEECTQLAQAFVQSRGYPPMEAGFYQVYDGLAVIEMIALQDGVLLYPDQLKLQLRMDTGEVVGLESNRYLMNHFTREGLTPTLTQEQALKAASPLLSVQRVRLCVIPEGQTERFCYELTGTYNEQTYLVYIDARTGEEAEVLWLTDGAEGPLAV